MSPPPSDRPSFGLIRRQTTLNCRSSSPRLIGWFQSEAVAQGAWPLAAARPKRSSRIRPGYDRNGLVTGHRLGNLAERQLCDFLTGSNRHGAVFQRLLMEPSGFLAANRVGTAGHGTNQPLSLSICETETSRKADMNMHRRAESSG